MSLVPPCDFTNCLNCNQPEKIIYKYHPAAGVWVGDNIGSWIDPRIVSANKSNNTVNCDVYVTSWRILIHLGVFDISQHAVIYYKDLCEIAASFNLLSFTPGAHGVKLVKAMGNHINLNSTRPHYVAAELWHSISVSILAHYESSGDILSGFNLVNSIKTTTLKVPSDFLELKGSDFANSVKNVFDFPCNAPPQLRKSYFQHKPSFVKSSANISSGSVSTEAAKKTIVVRDKDTSKNVVLDACTTCPGSCFVSHWFFGYKDYVMAGEPIARIKCTEQGSFVIRAMKSGYFSSLKDIQKTIAKGEPIALINSNSSEESMEQVESNVSEHISPQSFSAKLSTTVSAVNRGTLAVGAGKLPKFIPSVASIPSSFPSFGSYEGDLQFALANPQKHFQSFYNDVNPVGANGVINDDIISLNSFDESLYCALVREMHRYNLAEIADNKDELAKKNAGLGAMVGSMLGLMTGNIFAPFLGHSYGKNISDRGKRVEEFLPDPNLLFYQDQNSYLSWSKAQVVSPRLRRLILERRVKPDGNVFFRLVPAIVTADSVFPIQLFKVDSSTYFYRPLSAGIDRNQANYDAIKVQKRYFHLRGEGTVAETGTVIPVSGQDIEDYDCRIYRFKCSYLDYFYVDFKIQPGSVF